MGFLMVLPTKITSSFEEAARDARRHAAAMELGKLFTEHGRRGAVSALTIAMFAPGRFFDDHR